MSVWFSITLPPKSLFLSLKFLVMSFYSCFHCSRLFIPDWNLRTVVCSLIWILVLEFDFGMFIVQSFDVYQVILKFVVLFLFWQSIYSFQFLERNFHHYFLFDCSNICNDNKIIMVPSKTIIHSSSSLHPHISFLSISIRYLNLHPFAFNEKKKQLRFGVNRGAF